MGVTVIRAKSRISFVAATSARWSGSRQTCSCPNAAAGGALATEVVTCSSWPRRPQERDHHDSRQSDTADRDFGRSVRGCRQDASAQRDLRDLARHLTPDLALAVLPALLGCVARSFREPAQTKEDQEQLVGWVELLRDPSFPDHRSPYRGCGRCFRRRHSLARRANDLR